MTPLFIRPEILSKFGEDNESLKFVWKCFTEMTTNWSSGDGSDKKNGTRRPKRGLGKMNPDPFQPRVANNYYFTRCNSYSIISITFTCLNM